MIQLLTLQEENDYNYQFTICMQQATSYLKTGQSEHLQ